MKVRVKSTGEIINVYPDEYDDSGFIYNEVGEKNGMFYLKTYYK